MRLPTALARGARVALVAPAGPLHSTDELALAEQQARAFGWEPVVGEHALARDGYFAGTDEQRLRDLNAALADDSIAGIWCLRGGYGAMRLLDALDVGAMRRNPKSFIGYSDVTALHAAFGRFSDAITYHGPTARTTLTRFSRDSLERAVITRQNPCGSAPSAKTLRPGRARGRLVGGNLALLASLCGTRFAPDYTDGLLVMEDVGEATYRIDRMLSQLSMCGAFAQLKGIAFGHFTDGSRGKRPHTREVDEVLREVAEAIRVPVVSGIPLGHIDDQWTIPLGAMAELDADGLTLEVEQQ